MEVSFAERLYLSAKTRGIPHIGCDERILPRGEVLNRSDRGAPPLFYCFINIKFKLYLLI